MQKFLAPFPLVRLLIPFCIGIATGYYVDWSATALISICVAAAFGAIAGRILLSRSSRFYPLNGLAIFIFFFGTGMLILQDRNSAQCENESHVLTNVPVLVRLDGDPEIRENTVRCTARIIGVMKDSQWIDCNAGAMVYLKRNPQAEAVSYGDELLITSGVDYPDPPMNPDEFDYAGWLYRRGIGFVSFAKNNWTTEGHTEVSWIKARALELRNYFRNRMVECGLSGQELAVSEALLLGQSSDIDPQLLASYSASGTLHVLSVSGMHVALLFVVLLKLLAPLEKRRKLQLLSFAIQFFVIWFYAMLTGMSPSVLRSVTMLSVIITGRMIKRKAHLLNTLAASAILLLFADPMLLQDAGFLLSYCAVAGIVIVQPLIESWWTPQSKLAKPLWGLTTVTLAAQVFTFPLGLFFFRQFPTWFLLTNMIIIPLSTICLYAGLFLLCISWWKWAATLFAIAFGFLVSLLNSTVSLTEFMPAAVITSSEWSSVEIAVLYGLIIFALLALVRKKKYGLFGSLACMTLLLALIIRDRSAQRALQEIAVFQLQKGLVVGVAGSGESVLISDSTTVRKPEQFDYHVNPHYRNLGVDETQIVDRAQCDSMDFSFGKFYHGCIFTTSMKIWMGDEENIPPAGMLCDALIIHAKNFWLINELSAIETHEIILTGEVRSKWVDKWKSEGQRRKIPVYVTSETGARIFRFEN